MRRIATLNSFDPNYKTMKKLLTVYLLILPFALFSQAVEVISFGNSAYALIGEKGIRDDLGNYYMAGRRTLNNADRTHLACFNSGYSRQWSFYLDKSGIANKVLQTRDKHFVACYSTGASSLIFKFSANGSIIWFRNFSNIASLDDVYEDTAGDLYISGNMLDKNYVLKMNSSGTLIWSYQLQTDQGTNYFFGRRIQEVYDGNLVIAGFGTFVNNPTSGHLILTKISKQGQLIWSKIHHTAGKTITAVGFAESPVDQSLFTVGYTGDMMNVTTFDGFMMHTDSAGNHLSNSIYAYNYWDYFYDICSMGNGNMMALGMSKPVAVCGGNVFYVKYNAQADTVLTRIYGNPAGTGAIFNNIHRNNNNTYQSFGAGSLWGTIASGAEYICVTVDSNASGVCKSYAQQFQVSSATITTSGAVSISAFTPSFSTEYVKSNDTLFAANSCSGQALKIETTNTEPAITVYPNPVNDRLYLSASESISRVLVCDLRGVVVMQLTGDFPSLVVPTEQLKPGLYSISVETSSRRRKQISILKANE